MAKKVNSTLWKNESGFGTLGRLIVLYYIIGMAMGWVAIAYEGQGVLGGANVSINMTEEINATGGNFTLEKLNESVPKNPGGTGGFWNAVVSGIEWATASWGMFANTLFVVMAWPAKIAMGIDGATGTKIFTSLGILFTVMFYVAIFYWLRSGQ